MVNWEPPLLACASLGGEAVAEVLRIPSRYIELLDQVFGKLAIKYRLIESYEKSNMRQANWRCQTLTLGCFG